MAASLRFTLRRVCKLQQSTRLQFSNSRLASAFEGNIDGDTQTTVTILNKEAQFQGMMIDAMGTYGFKLNNGVRLIGPVALFPRSALQWNIRGVDDITEDSLALFPLLVPKLDLLVIGAGDNEDANKLDRFKLLKFLRSHSIGAEILPTERAITTYNYLVAEQRYVAGAFLPPKYIHRYEDEEDPIYFDKPNFDTVPNNLEESLLHGRGEFDDLIGPEADERRRKAWGKLIGTDDREKKWKEKQKNPKEDLE